MAVEYRTYVGLTPNQSTGLELQLHNITLAVTTEDPIEWELDKKVEQIFHIKSQRPPQIWWVVGQFGPHGCFLLCRLVLFTTALP